MDRLTLPGRPGLIIPSSPVHHPDYGNGVCATIDGKYATVAFRGIRGHAWRTCTVPLAELSLRLDVATGRAHAAWRLAATHRGWPGEIKSVPEPYQGGHWGPYRGVPGQWCVHHRNMCSVCASAKNVPALADINPNDPRILPDGSRFVDAEALRLVFLHNAEVTP